MATHFDLAGRATLTLDDGDPGLTAYLAGQMDPFAPSGRGGAPELVLEPDPSSSGRRWIDVQKPANDGLVTASDGEDFAILDEGCHCTVPDPLAEGPLRFGYKRGFPLERIFAPVIRAALQFALAPHSVALHSTTVELGGGAVAVAGWSESGKTETALALMESGARFMSDKWTVVGADGGASAFPVRVGIRRWVLRYLPRLRASLPAVANAQLAVAGAASTFARAATARFQTASAAGRASALLADAASLGERASLTPSQLRAAYGDTGEPSLRRPLRTVAVLTTLPPGESVQAEPIDPAWAADRLARSAAFERRRFFDLHERARYALPGRPTGLVAESIARERALLESVLAGVALVGVRAPFPTDPRVVASAVERFL